MRLSSSAFDDDGMIPQRYGRDGDNVNPSLAWKYVPEHVQSFALIMEDPDVPPSAGIPIWDHWVVWNIPPHVTQIPDGWIVEGMCGRGTRGELVYGGPRPPDREHRYFFHLYALDQMLPLLEGSTKNELIATMEGHVLASASLMGRFAPMK